MITSKLVWKGISKEVSAWSKACIACQKAKIQSHVKAPLQTFEVPNKRFDHIHIDLVGPLPPSHVQFGLPADISSDRGPQFTSKLWTSLAIERGTKEETISIAHLDPEQPVQTFQPNSRGRPPKKT